MPVVVRLTTMIQRRRERRRRTRVPTWKHPASLVVVKVCGVFLLILLMLSTTSTMRRKRAPSSASALLLQGKRILITGGGRGIGRALALICHAEGAARVIITARTAAELAETVRLAETKTATATTSREARIEQTSKAAALLASRRPSAKTKRTNTNAMDRRLKKATTSIGARRSGSATRARKAGTSAMSQIVTAMTTGTSSINNIDTTDTTTNPNPNRMDSYVCDVTNPQDVDTLVRDICGLTSCSDDDTNNKNTDAEDGTSSNSNGSIDILINNAGGSQGRKGPVGTLTTETFESLFKLNVVGPELITSTLLKYKAFGTTTSEEDTHSGDGDNAERTTKVILNVSSKAGKVGLENYSYYVATKFALEGLTSSWSKELRASSSSSSSSLHHTHPPIRVHSFSPGMVNTQSFPKPDPSKPGIREASSIQACLLYILTGRHHSPPPPNPSDPPGPINTNDSKNTNDDNNDDATHNTKTETDTETDRSCVTNQNTDTDTTATHNHNTMMMDYTGHYMHIDEYEQVIQERGVDNAHLAWKAIDETQFKP